MLFAGFSLKEDPIPGNVHRKVQDGCWDGIQPARYEPLHPSSLTLPWSAADALCSTASGEGSVFKTP